MNVLIGSGGWVAWRSRRRLGTFASIVWALLSVLETGVSVAQVRRIDAYDLATLRDLASVSVSPDGRDAVFQVLQADPARNRYETGWFITSLHIPGATPRRLASVGELSQSDATANYQPAPPPIWSPDGKWIVYLRTDNGRTQIWRTHRDGGGEEQLTHGDGDVRAWVVSRDGRLILFEIQPSRAQMTAALEIEGRSGFLYDRRFVPLHGPLPVRVASGLEDGSHGRNVRAYEWASRRERPANNTEKAEFMEATAPPRPGERAQFRGERVVSAAGAVAWTEARESERQGGLAPLTIVAQLLSSPEPVVCTAPECTGQRITGLWWRGENEVVFARGAGYLLQDAELYAWRPGETAGPKFLLRTSEALLGRSRCAIRVAQDRLVCFHERASLPRRLVALDLNAGVIRTLFDPNPDFARFELGQEPRRIEIRTASGVETFGILVLPPRYTTGQRLPLVIVTYRCSGFLRGGTGDEYPVHPLAAHEHAVLCFNTPDVDYRRLATMSWREYEEWGRGAGDPERHRVLDSLDAAVAQLDAMGIVDPRRIALTGLSFGAETVHFALFNMPSLAAAIASGGSLEPASAFLMSVDGLDTARRWGLGSIESERWNALALSRNVARVRAPLLLNVADREMIGALEAFTALRDTGRAVEMYVFPDEQHFKWQPAHRLAIYNRNIDWLNFWLRGVEDSDPAKTAQYERWRAMRAKQCERLKGEGAPWYCRQNLDQSASQ